MLEIKLKLDMRMTNDNMTKLDDGRPPRAAMTMTSDSCRVVAVCPQVLVRQIWEGNPLLYAGPKAMGVASEVLPALDFHAWVFVRAAEFSIFRHFWLHW